MGGYVFHHAVPHVGKVTLRCGEKTHVGWPVIAAIASTSMPRWT